MLRSRDDYDDIRLNNGPKPMSGLGLASLLIAIGVILLEFLLVGIIVLLTAENNGQMNENDPAAIVLGLGILGSIGINLIGLVLGIVGCFQADRSIVLAVIGTTLNGLVLFGAASFFCVALIMGG
jgi:hypothetical protein